MSRYSLYSMWFLFYNHWDLVGPYTHCPHWINACKGSLKKKKGPGLRCDLESFGNTEWCGIIRCLESSHTLKFNLQAEEPQNAITVRSMERQREAGEGLLSMAGVVMYKPLRYWVDGWSNGHVSFWQLMYHNLFEPWANEMAYCQSRAGPHFGFRGWVVVIVLSHLIWNPVIRGHV